MKAQLINIGRGKVNKTVEVLGEKELWKEVGKYIASKGWGTEETETKDTFDIVAGVRTVGQVKIIEY